MFQHSCTHTHTYTQKKTTPTALHRAPPRARPVVSNNLFNTMAVFFFYLQYPAASPVYSHNTAAGTHNHQEFTRQSKKTLTIMNLYNLIEDVLMFCNSWMGKKHLSLSCQHNQDLNVL